MLNGRANYDSEILRALPATDLACQQTYASLVGLRSVDRPALERVIFVVKDVELVERAAKMQAVFIFKTNHSQL